MDKAQVESYRALKHSGADVQKHNQIRFNGGSETIRHVVCKALAGYVGQINGYRVSSEVELENGGQIDVVLFGHPERLSYAVEIETSPVEWVVNEKLDRYVKDTAIDELVVINPNEVPLNVLEAADYIANELGLSL